MSLHLGKMTLVPIVWKVILHLVLKPTSHSNLDPDLLTGLLWSWHTICKDVKEVNLSLHITMLAYRGSRYTASFILNLNTKREVWSASHPSYCTLHKDVCSKWNVRRLTLLLKLLFVLLYLSHKKYCVTGWFICGISVSKRYVLAISQNLLLVNIIWEVNYSNNANSVFVLVYLRVAFSKSADR
jgi:hypothetical protein